MAGEAQCVAGLGLQGAVASGDIEAARGAPNQSIEFTTVVGSLRKLLGFMRVRDA